MANRLIGFVSGNGPSPGTAQILSVPGLLKTDRLVSVASCTGAGDGLPFFIINPVTDGEILMMPGAPGAFGASPCMALIERD